MSITAEEMSKVGGPWLERVRGFMQVRFMNGDSVAWGSRDVLMENGPLTVCDLENLAAQIAADAINHWEDRQTQAKKLPRRGA